MLTDEEMRVQYEARAQAERDAGANITIDRGLPCIEVNLSDVAQYFFQGDDAVKMLDEVPDWISAEDFILAQAQNW